METYEIIYDYCGEDGNCDYNIREEFTGTWEELQQYIKQMKRNGCYNISATDITPEGYEESVKLKIKETVLNESRSEVADKITEIVGLQGFWTREDEFVESMEDEGLSVDYIDYETAEISSNDSEETCRVYFNRGGKSFTIGKIKCFDEDGNSFWYEEEDLSESLDDDYTTYRVWYRPFDYPDEEDYVDIYARDTKDARYRGNAYGYVTEVEMLVDGLQEKVEISEVYSEDDDLEDLIQSFVQEYDSAVTSINSSKLPTIFSLVQKLGGFKPGTVNADVGGGRFDNAAQYLKDYDVLNLVWDPFNRTKEHNKDVIDFIKKNGGSNTVTCSNVLNVIKEPENRLAVIKNCDRLVKKGGTVYFTVYEGSGSGEGKADDKRKSYQTNMKTADYQSELEKVFKDVKRKGKLFICK